MNSGLENRSRSSTDLNSQSSRSHAIFSFTLVQNIWQNEDFKIITSKLSFVDLAGSERLKRTGAVGTQVKEGISINSGLLALGNVISALADKQPHIPYRESKLTRLLQDSLGGNTKTLILFCCSPTFNDMAETLNTLKYANRSRCIKNSAHANIEYASEIQQLKEVISGLKNELGRVSSGKCKKYHS